MQRAIFRKHRDIAAETGLPLIVHTREAEADTAAILREAADAGVGGVLHCFSSSRQLAEKALELGFYISISGIVTFKAAEELRAIDRRAFPPGPSARQSGWTFGLRDLKSRAVGDVTSTLVFVLAAVASVLLIACVNAVNLLLARAMRRRGELAIRAALGATRIRLVRQLTMESVMLALSGGALGLALARAARPALIALLPSGTPRTASIAVDPAVAWFALGLSVLTAVLFGMAPALIAAPRRLSADLKSGVRAAGSRSGARWSSALVIAQLATVLVLVAGAGLMLRTLWMLQQRETGIDVARLLALDVTLPDARARGRSAAVGDIERMIGRLEALPGVESAAAVQTLPLAGRGPSANIRVEGRAFPAGEAPDVVWKPITPDYFRTVGTRIVRGRAFTDADRDGAAPVAIVNARLAELLWPDGDPIGARIGTGLDGNGAPLTVVGVVSDAQQEGIGADVLPEMYRPLAQPARFGVDAMSLVLRTAGDPTALAAAARQAVRDVHPLAPIPAVRPLQAIVDAGLASESTALRALGAFGGLALVLAAVGLYGVMARLVGDRARDLGIRMALGAEPRAVRWLVLRRSLSLCAVALAMGVLLSMAVSRQLGALLHGAAPVDPLVLSGASLVLVLAALAASYLPARRASRIDPLLVLKQE